MRSPVWPVMQDRNHSTRNIAKAHTVEDSEPQAKSGAARGWAN